MVVLFYRLGKKWKLSCHGLVSYVFDLLDPFVWAKKKGFAAVRLVSLTLGLLRNAIAFCTAGYSPYHEDDDGLYQESSASVSLFLPCLV